MTKKNNDRNRHRYLITRSAPFSSDGMIRRKPAGPRLLLVDGVRVSYSLRGARGNPEMEAFFSRFKTENRSLLLDCQTLEELTGVIARRIGYYNRDRRHSKIGYVAPLIYAETMRAQP